MATGIVHSYTLECHYQTGRRLNVLTQKYNSDTLPPGLNMNKCFLIGSKDIAFGLVNPVLNTGI
jgi:hypothetical protein